LGHVRGRGGLERKKISLEQQKGRREEARDQNKVPEDRAKNLQQKRQQYVF